MLKRAQRRPHDAVWLAVAIVTAAIALAVVLDLAGVIDWMSPLGVGST